MFSKNKFIDSFNSWYRYIVLTNQITISVILMSSFFAGIATIDNRDQIPRIVTTITLAILSSFTVYWFFKRKLRSYFILLTQYVSFLIFSLTSIVRGSRDLRY